MRIFWYSINKFDSSHPWISKKGIKKILFLPNENYGDLMSKFLAEKIGQEKTKWFDPKTEKSQSHFFVIGSILNFNRPDSIVWGSGIINRTHNISNSDFRAVRGPWTRKRLLEENYNCPEVYGDPALLLPEYYNPRINKQYKLGIVPHYTEYSKVKFIFQYDRKVNVINLLTLNIESVTEEILKCDYIISSSLHGLIVAHAYEIPAVWVKFSNNLFGDDIKFCDYLESLNMEYYKPNSIVNYYNTEDLLQIFRSKVALPSAKNIDSIKNKLLQNCPF